jgi:hypothetical protein
MTNEYLNRLKKMGYKPHEAVHILEHFHKYFNKEYLELLITSMENEHYVANVQPKSHR